LKENSMDDPTNNTPSLNPNYGNSNSSDDGYDQQGNVNTAGRLDQDQGDKSNPQINKTSQPIQPPVVPLDNVKPSTDLNNSTSNIPQDQESASVVNPVGTPNPVATDTNTKNTSSQIPNTSTPMNANYEKAQAAQQAQVVDPEKAGLSDKTKTIITVILLLTIFPVGIILMWVWTSWKTWVKAFITIGLGCLSIVIIILTVMSAATLIAVNPTEQFSKAKDTKMLSDATTISNALRAYKLDNEGAYPWNVDNTLMLPPTTGKTGLVISKADWLVGEKNSLVSEGYLSSMDSDGEDLSEIYIFYNKTEDTVKICFDPVSESNYITTGYDQFGVQSPTGGYSCIP
jgi:hypothetical protein